MDVHLNTLLTFNKLTAGDQYKYTHLLLDHEYSLFFYWDVNQSFNRSIDSNEWMSTFMPSLVQPHPRGWVQRSWSTPGWRRTRLGCLGGLSTPSSGRRSLGQRTSSRPRSAGVHRACSTTSFPGTSPNSRSSPTSTSPCHPLLTSWFTSRTSWRKRER